MTRFPAISAALLLMASAFVAPVSVVPAFAAATDLTVETDTPHAATPLERPSGGDVDLALEAAVEWTLLHGLGHALVADNELALPGAEEAAVDDFASTRMLARYGDEDGAERLAAAAEIFFLQAADEDADFYGEHLPDERRAFRIACMVEGTDEDVGADLAAWAGLPENAFEACGDADRDIQTEAWDVLLSDSLLLEDEPPAEVTVAYEGEGAALDWLRESGLLEAFANETASTYAFFDPLAVTARACGEPDAFYEPGTGIVVCAELADDLGALALASAGADDADGGDEAAASELSGSEASEATADEPQPATE